MAFCDFCSCGNCQHGAPWLAHAPTTDGRWICDVCWKYHLNCEPKLAGAFVKLTKEELAALEAKGIKHYTEMET